ncbi:hypothetical protein FA95DRAFT_410076 [Auriscalpium vulgare]|uniref:Uncharacterized protein n=1 Tax=Auriscalpium vulgare TaxID=40419 RepID=A0ACB8RHD2_9AGAM|nr:hypothetical protein FA95DRAFT_410076 [Auriscalpium vulgare]
MISDVTVFTAGSVTAQSAINDVARTTVSELLPRSPMPPLFLVQFRSFLLSALARLGACHVQSCVVPVACLARCVDAIRESVTYDAEASPPNVNGIIDGFTRWAVGGCSTNSDARQLELLERCTAAQNTARAGTLFIAFGSDFEESQAESSYLV